MNRREFTATMAGSVLATTAIAQFSTGPAAASAAPSAGAGRVPGDVLFWSVEAQRRALTARRFTAVALTRAYLARIASLNPTLNAFVQVDAPGALAAAAAADARIATGDRTPLLGIPIGVKDLIDVAGLRTTYGSTVFADNTAERDAPAVRRLRDAGAVILGKTNTTEFALGAPSTLHGPSANPWDLERTAGGSSNGSATAVSAALCSLAVGTDTAGSIRTPASFCGVYGLKPTFGRVPAEGIGVLSTFMDTVGPMGRTARDIALALHVMAGYEPTDATSADEPVPDYPAMTGGPGHRVTVGAPDEWVTRDLDPAVRAAWRRTLDNLNASGVRVRTVTLPDVTGAFAVWRGLTAGDAYLWHRPTLTSKADLYSPGTRALLQSFSTVTAVELAEARREQWDLHRAITAAMTGIDTIIVPATPVPAPTNTDIVTGRIPAGDKVITADLIPALALPFNVTGQPSMTVPVGLTDSGLPVAVQVVGRRFDERAVLRTGAAIQTTVTADLRPPRYR